MTTPSFQKIVPRVENEDDRTPEEIAEKRRKRIWIICMCVVIVAGIIIAINARSISHGIKDWQAERAAREAEKFLAANDYKSAQGKVQDALALSPQNLAAMLTAARFLTTAGAYKDAIAFWVKLEEKRPLSPEDQRRYATCLLGTGDLLQAGNHAKLAWPNGSPGQPDDWMLALNLALQRRDETAAVDLAQKLMASTSATADQSLKAATLMTSSSNPSQRAEAWKLIETRSQDKTETGLEALVTLARRAASVHSNQTPLAEGETAMSPQAVADAIEANPKAQAKHLLFAMDLRLLVEPLRKTELIAAAEEKFTGNDDDLEALTSWLYGKGEYRKVLVHLPGDVAAHRRSLFLQSLDALAAMGRWKEVVGAINGASFALDKVTAEMYLARCSKELGETSGADSHWHSALDAANGNAQQLALIGDYAERSGNIAIAKAGFQAATEARDDFLPAYQRLLAIAQAEGDTTGLNTTLRRMSARWPDEAAVRNDLAYTDLLLQKNIEDSTKIAEALFAKDPTSLPHRITLSLARLRGGNTTEAAQVLDNLTGNLGTLEARKRAVQAAALWANDQKSEAKSILQDVKLNQLFPEERELVSGVQ